MPIFSSALATAAKIRKNHLYLMSPASWSLSATVPTVSSAVTSMVVSRGSLLNPHRSDASSQPTDASSADSSTTQMRYSTGFTRRRRLRPLPPEGCPPRRGVSPWRGAAPWRGASPWRARSLRRTCSLSQLAVSPRLKSAMYSSVPLRPEAEALFLSNYGARQKIFPGQAPLPAPAHRILTKLRSEVTTMCSHSGNDSCLWLILLLVVLVCCCGGFGGESGCACGRGCGESCC